MTSGSHDDEVAGNMVFVLEDRAYQLQQRQDQLIAFM